MAQLARHWAPWPMQVCKSSHLAFLEFSVSPARYMAILYASVKLERATGFGRYGKDHRRPLSSHQDSLCVSAIGLQLQTSINLHCIR